MVILILITCALACDLPQLPPSLSFFSSNYPIEGSIQGSGRFVASNMKYSFEVSSQSWLRIAAEPKKSLIEISVFKGQAQVLYANAKSLGIAHLAGELAKGTYELVLSIEEIPSSESNIFDCPYPNLYFAIGLVPYSSLLSLKSLDYSSSLPDISDLSESLDYMFGYSKTYESCSIPFEKLSDPYLFTYPISVPGLPEELKGFGFTGIWELTFSIRNV